MGTEFGGDDPISEWMVPEDPISVVLSVLYDVAETFTETRAVQIVASFHAANQNAGSMTTFFCACHLRALICNFDRR